jgi:hypothetical protein
MSNKFLNVHIFDGKLKGLFTPSRIYSVDDKKDAFYNLIGKLNNQAAIITVQTMINDLSFNNNRNYQHENNIDSSDILMELIQWIDNLDILQGLDEQLADAKNLGICPSGRVTRLFQLWSAFVHSDEEKQEKQKNNVV